MANRRISHARGKGSLNHNNRNHIYKNVDPTKTENNIYYAKESLEEAYQKCFGEALANYNAKQKRADRKIEDYYTHLFGNQRKDVVATSSNKEKSFYEIVVGIGDKDTCPSGSVNGNLACRALEEYAQGFEKRNPNFYVFNSVLHQDEKTPHLHIDYIPVAHGYKNGLETRNSHSVALQQMGFGRDKDAVNKWRIQERKILREICDKYGLEIAEETKGRGKTFTPDEYKKIRDEAKTELKADPELLDELKEGIRADVEDELLSEQQHLVNEISNHRKEALELMDKKDDLKNEVEEIQNSINAEKAKLTSEQKNFSAMQKQFKPRKDDLEKITKLKNETKPHILTSNITISKAAWDFIIGIAEQHARISDTTLAALEKHSEDTEKLKRCQSLYLALAAEVAAMSWGDKDKIKHRVQDVMKDIEDWRVVAWLVDGMKKYEPSDLEEILQIRQAKIDKKLDYARQQREYNQPKPAPQKTKKQNHSRDGR